MKLLYDEQVCCPVMHVRDTIGAWHVRINLFLRYRVRVTHAHQSLYNRRFPAQACNRLAVVASPCAQTRREPRPSAGARCPCRIARGILLRQSSPALARGGGREKETWQPSSRSQRRLQRQSVATLAFRLRLAQWGYWEAIDWIKESLHWPLFSKSSQLSREARHQQ